MNRVPGFLAVTAALLALGARRAAAEAVVQAATTAPKAAPQQMPAGAKPSVDKSTAAAASGEPQTVQDLYHGDQRDPFQVQFGGGAPGAGAENPEAVVEFSIHNLALRGIMQDRGGDFAVLAERGTGNPYVLKKGRLYDHRNKLVKGVTGSVKPKQKMVALMTPDRDVQTLILGEDEEAEKKP